MSEKIKEMSEKKKKLYQQLHRDMLFGSCTEVNETYHKIETLKKKMEE